MADRGFTVKDMLQEVEAELNIPPLWKADSNCQQKYRRET